MFLLILRCMCSLCTLPGILLRRDMSMHARSQLLTGPRVSPPASTSYKDNEYVVIRMPCLYGPSTGSCFLLIRDHSLTSYQVLQAVNLVGLHEVSTKALIFCRIASISQLQPVQLTIYTEPDLSSCRPDHALLFLPLIPLRLRSYLEEKTSQQD